MDDHHHGHDEMLTAAQISEELGVAVLTVRGWIRRGELRSVRLGKRLVRVRRSALNDFIAAGEQQ